MVLCMSWGRWQMFEIIERHRVSSSCSHGHFARLTDPRCAKSVGQLHNECTRLLVRLSASLLDVVKAARTPGDCIQMLPLVSLGARQLVQMNVSIPPRKSVCWQPVPSREKQGGSRKRTVWAAARNVPPNPLPGPVSHEQWAPRSHPGATSWRWPSLRFLGI